MKTHTTLLLFCLLFCNGLIAQNWSPLNTEETFYYDSGGEDLTGIRVDSVAVVEGDTVWYTNLLVELQPDLEFNPILCSEFDAEGAIMRAGFMQFEIHAQEAGIYKFQNPDTFEIHAQAAIGSEWIYSVLYGEEVVTATVTEAVSSEVLGEPDSVKTISLSDGRNILLSKNHGLIESETSNNDTFYLSGIADRKLGTYPISRHEIYDFSQGDVFVYLQQGGYSEEYSKALIRVEIEDVTDTGDELEIQYSRAEYRRIWVMTEVQPGIFIHDEIDPQISNAPGLMYPFFIANRHTSDVIPKTAFNHSNGQPDAHPFFWDFPEEYPIFNRYVFSGEVNGRVTKEVGGSPAFLESYISAAEQFGELELFSGTNDETIYYHFLDSSYFDESDTPILLNDTAVFSHGTIGCPEIHEYFGFGEGLGVISYQNFSGLGSGEQIMVGYRKGTEEFGYVPTSAEVVSVGINEVAALPEVGVYPVPATNNLWFDSENTDAVEVYDLTGKPVLNHSLSGTRHQLNISALSSGMYFGHLLNDGQPKGRFKFVKSE